MCQLCDVTIPEIDATFEYVTVEDLIAALFNPAPYDSEVATEPDSCACDECQGLYDDKAKDTDKTAAADPYSDAYAAEVVGRIAAIDKLTAILENSADTETVLAAASLLLQR